MRKLACCFCFRIVYDLGSVRAFGVKPSPIVDCALSRPGTILVDQKYSNLLTNLLNFWAIEKKLHNFGQQTCRVPGVFMLIKFSPNPFKEHMMPAPLQVPTFAIIHNLPQTASYQLLPFAASYLPLQHLDNCLHVHHTLTTPLLAMIPIRILGWSVVCGDPVAVTILFLGIL